MSDCKTTRTVKVVNRDGIHLRAASLVAKTVRRFRARVELVKDRHRVDGTDVLQIISLGAGQGHELVLEATGPEADAAVEALVQLFAGKFGENTEAQRQEH